MARRQETVAVIMGGGRGTRLFPLTKDRCKPAVPLGGRYRLIDIPISNCVNSSINQIYVLTQFNTASLHRHIERTYQFDIFSGGFCAIHAAQQTYEGSDWYQGTADAVRQNMRYILSNDPKIVLILSGDQLYRMNYQELIRFHKEREADVTISVQPVNRETAQSMGLLHIDREFRITRFVEKPKDPKILDQMKVPTEALKSFGFPAKTSRRYLANMGIYVFESEALIRALERTDLVDFGKEVIPENLGTLQAFAYPFAGFWEDIGTIKAFYETNMMLLDRHSPFTFFDPEAPIFTRPRFLPPTKFLDCRIERSVVAEGGYLEECEIYRSLLANRSVVRAGSVLRDVFMMGADEMEGREERKENVRLERPDIGVGPNCRIQRAIIDKGARIGAGVTIQNHETDSDFDGEFFYIRDGITIIPRRAVVPEGSVI